MNTRKVVINGPGLLWAAPLTITILLALALSAPASAQAPTKTLAVPSEHKTIQAAVNAASEGDTILVAAGTYRENIKLKKGVVLRGSGARSTTIDGGGSGNVVQGAEGSVLEGFTITGSGSMGRSGNLMDMGISADHAPMTIANCIVSGNNGGIRVFYSPSNIVNNVIKGNKVHGIYNLYSDSLVANNLVFDNNGYGISNSYSRPRLLNNTIHNNRAGIYAEVSIVEVTNNIVANNKETGIFWAEFPDSQIGAEPRLSHNLVFGNGEDLRHVTPGPGAVAKDPLFKDASNNDLRLKKSSPAVDSGSAEINDPDSSRSDMGAFGGEMAQAEIPVSPDVKSYAELKAGSGAIEEPDYTDMASWGGAQGTASGQGNFSGYCMPCHGPLGKGDGILAESLPVLPRNLAKVEYMTALTDEHLFKVIKEGGPAVGFTENMTPFSDQLSDKEIRNIVAYIRSDICKCTYKGK